MPKQVDFTMKTRGWKVDSQTEATSSDNTGAAGVTYKEADYYNLTIDGRLAFAELQQTDLTGIEIMRDVCFPQGWDIQEPIIPYCYLNPQESYQAEGGSVALGLPAELDCIDIWSTKKLTEEDFNKIVMGVGTANGYNQVFPGFLNVHDLNDAAMLDPFWDQEQIICGRSRFWNISADITKSNFSANAAVRKMPMNLIHDLRWGLMEPIASSILHHARIWRMSIPCFNPPNTRFQTTTNWFYTLPMSNQPMMTLASDPGFVERMTMERRSRDV
jgi:hypothetical protein